MANQIAPFGFQDLERREGASPMYGLTKVAIASSDPNPIFNGDLVQDSLVTPLSGNTANYITQASNAAGLTGSNAYRGVFRGCEYLNTAVGRVVWSSFWPAAGAGADALAYIVDDDRMLFIAQCSTANITVPVGSSQIGLNVSATAISSTGNTTSGFSVAAISSFSTAGSGSSLPFRFIDFYSNYAPGVVFPAPSPPGGYPGGTFVNGVDNTTVGQILVLQANNWATKGLAVT